MVAALFHPLNIFILGLGGGFVIPLLYRLGKGWLHTGFFIALGGLTAVSGVSLLGLLTGGPTIDIATAGAPAPVAITLRFGLWEGAFAFGVNLVALFGAIHLWDRLRGDYASLLLYLILVMGIDGMVMTRDLFNLFVFLEIVSIATYGLLGLGRESAAIEAAFKYIFATVIASTFFLMGTAFVYFAAGTLNIDALVAAPAALAGPIGATATILLLACLLIELKPFPANGWGLDVYETAPSGVAALVSVGVSAGIFFALLKLLPLFQGQLGLIALSGGVTFLMSNLIGLRQTNIQRLLGYSSIGQMGLMLIGLALLQEIGATEAIPIVVGGLFANHLFAKAGLFWFKGLVGNSDIDTPLGFARRPLLAAVFGLFLVAIAGLPPFPGFWAKWELVMRLTAAGKLPWIGVILAGSLLEAAYMFKWFTKALRASDEERPAPGWLALTPPLAMAALLIASGVVAARISGAGAPWMFAPLACGALLYTLDGLPGRIKAVLMLTVVLVVGGWLAAGTIGIARLFAILLLAGSLVIAAASLYRSDRRPGYYPLLATLLLSIPALLRSTTSLEFFFSWEIIALASCFLIAMARGAGAHVLTFLLFSLFSAFFLLAGFATVASRTGTTDLLALAARGPEVTLAFALLAVGFLVKAGVLGAHVWLPGAYAEADDDFSAMLSGVVSKVAMFGLLIGAYVAVRSDASLDVARVVAWVGMATTIGGAVLALGEDDFKRLLAYSSMSQLGYIIVAIALMSHLGWVTALYLVANHMMVKGVLFLAVAGIILRTGVRSFVEIGGLRRTMPLTFATVVIAVVAMSGLPPLMGFGGKWLLLHAMAEKGWIFLAIATLIATFLGLLYMTRLVSGLFLGAPRTGQAAGGEAPMALLAPQFVLIAGMLVLSFFPKLLMEPVSAAIDPQFASTLVWQGKSLEAIYDYWNPTPTMFVALAASAMLFVVAWLLHRGGRLTPFTLDHFFAYWRSAIARMVPPVATQFWQGIADGARGAAGMTRRVYTGDGQTYALYVVLYFLALYLASMGFGSRLIS